MAQAVFQMKVKKSGFGWEVRWPGRSLKMQANEWPRGDLQLLLYMCNIELQNHEIIET